MGLNQIALLGLLAAAMPSPKLPCPNVTTTAENEDSAKPSKCAKELPINHFGADPCAKMPLQPSFFDLRVAAGPALKIRRHQSVGVGIDLAMALRLRGSGLTILMPEMGYSMFAPTNAHGPADHFFFASLGIGSMGRWIAAGIIPGLTIGRVHDHHGIGRTALGARVSATAEITEIIGLQATYSATFDGHYISQDIRATASLHWYPVLVAIILAGS